MSAASLLGLLALALVSLHLIKHLLGVGTEETILSVQQQQRGLADPPLGPFETRHLWVWVYCQPRLCFIQHEDVHKSQEHFKSLQNLSREEKALTKTLDKNPPFLLE